MKKIKLIPLLATAALLSACDLGGGINIKAPKFANEGSEYTFAELLEVVNSEEFLGEFSKSGYDDVPSATIRNSASYVQEQKVKEDSKVISDHSRKQSSSSLNTYDVTNMRIEQKSETKGIEKDKDPTGSSSYTTSTKTEQALRYTTVNAKDMLVLVNKLDKTYRENMDATGLDEDARRLDIKSRCEMDVVGETTAFRSIVTSYSTMSEEIQKRYKCYKNDKIYTIKVSYEEETETKDSSDNVVYKIKTAQSGAIQIDATKGSTFTLKYAAESTQTYTFIKDASIGYDDYRAGQVMETTVKQYEEVSCSTKDVNLKELDLSSYTFVE